MRDLLELILFLALASPLGVGELPMLETQQKNIILEILDIHERLCMAEIKIAIMEDICLR